MNTRILLKYARQPSTWRGVIGVLSAIGISLSPELTEAIVIAAVALIGVVEVVRNETQKEG